MPLFPTRHWVAEYDRLLAENSALTDLVAGFGSPGDVLLVIRDLPLAETTIDDLPEAVTGDLPPNVRDGLADLTLAAAPSVIGPTARETMPDIAADLLEQLESYVHDGDIYVRVDISDGDTPQLTLLGSPTVHDTDTVVSGSCASWQRIVDGRPALSALVAGDLTISGNGLDLVQYGTIFQLLGDIAADVETTHLFADPDSSFPDDVLDETLRQPIAVQRTVQRTVTTVLQTVTPF